MPSLVVGRWLSETGTVADLEEVLKALTDQQLAHRKRVQAGLSVATATLGLTALATKGGAGLVRQAAKKAPQAKALKLKRVADKMDSHNSALLTTGAGLGGIAGFNSASISRKEADEIPKKPRKPVIKNWDDYDRHRRLEHTLGRHWDKLAQREQVHPLIRHYGLSKPLPQDLDHKKRAEIWEQRDKRLNQKRNRYERTENTAKLTQRAAEGTAAVGGGILGLSAVRNAYEDEHKGWGEAYAARKGTRAAKIIGRYHPGFKVIALTAGATGVGYAANATKRAAAAQKRKYSTPEGGVAARAHDQIKKSATLEEVLDSLSKTHS